MTCNTNPGAVYWFILFISGILFAVCMVVFDEIILPRLKRKKRVAKLVTSYNALTSEYTAYFECWPRIQCISDNEKDSITGLYYAFSADENSECGLVIKGAEDVV